MSEEKHLDNDPERTLVTLEQLSQTIEVMTNVVNRLRKHLSDQLKDQTEAQQVGKQTEPQPRTNEETELPSYKSQQKSKSQQRESFVVEIKQQETEPVRKSSKTLH
ncbi:MAG: hypothetical protein VX928_05470 [Pseudomonadota bacterium]|nr:hypothetical protein [Pseudomonadota bacterium]